MSLINKKMITRALLIMSVLIKGAATRDTKEIVGGEPAEKGRYPYMVGLINDNGILWCGGILIDPMWVLSAARCARRFSKVEIGRLDRSNKTEEYELIDIDFEAPHPNFSPITGDKDIMLVRLKEPSKITPVLIDYGSEGIFAGRDVTVMGWGATMDGGILSVNMLHEATIQIQDKDECAEAYIEENTVITDNMICASSVGKGACSGDGGGPLIVKGQNSTEDIVVGIAAFGIGCVEEDFPGVYTAMSTMASYVDFILGCSIDNSFESQECCGAMCLGGRFLCQEATCDTTDDVFCTERSYPNDGFDYSDCPAEFPCYVGDGYCDEELYNTPECNYDGGDCCNFTCTDAEYQCADNAFETCLLRVVDEESIITQIESTFMVLFGLIQTFLDIFNSLFGG